ncbi:hypothetical protein DNTS_000462 [Danionella cerebrum]|uniref:IRS-type PTB domain-containing protein n=1 Tax=Danionella cerebrum TaxID=2873325 RepID=A0A553P9B4_9TELE|nr:hypothetical protein DNTS_000462 [Danionella translucida]
MEEDIIKRGILYFQQQRFGKKWRKVWSVLYQENSCSISRLEFFEFKDWASNVTEKANRKQDNKKVIKLSDCIRVSEVDVEGCPREFRPFLVETTDKTYVFAAEMGDLEDWIQKLCETAFRMKWAEKGAVRGNCSQPETDNVTMADNTLYGSRESMTVRQSEASERCGLKGIVLLRTDSDSLLVKEPKTGEVLYCWPYQFLRRFGRDKATFSFEAGRRCDSGEGNFEFDTKQGNTIFQSVEAAINLHRINIASKQQSTLEHDQKHSSSRMLAPGDMYSLVSDVAPKPPQNTQQSRLEAPTEKLLTSVRSLNLDTRPPPRKNQVKNFRSCPLANTEDDTYSRAMAPDSDRVYPGEKRELKDRRSTCSNPDDSDYSLPFDTIDKNVNIDILSTKNRQPSLPEPSCEMRIKGKEEIIEPLYDMIDETAIRNRFTNKQTHPCKMVEHIYDEPEGFAVPQKTPLLVYDEPEEVKSHAWKMLGTVTDPSGHEFPYNASVDDYAVPKPPRRALLSKKKESEEESSPYDNIMVNTSQMNK